MTSDLSIDLSAAESRALASGAAVEACWAVQPQPRVPPDATDVRMDGLGFAYTTVHGACPIRLWGDGDFLRCPVAPGDVVGVREPWRVWLAADLPLIEYESDDDVFDPIAGFDHRPWTPPPSADMPDAFDLGTVDDGRWRPAASMPTWAIRHHATVLAVLPPALRDGRWVWRATIRLEACDAR